MTMEKLKEHLDNNGPEYYTDVLTDNAAAIIKNAGYLVVLTGAGISTESGLPDFRSSGGLWDGLRPEEISHWSAVGTEAFREFFTKRIQDVQSHEPNVGHEVLAKWERDGLVKTILTQNIDGYHQQAGSTSVNELHGQLRTLECDACETVYDSSLYTHFNEDLCEVCDEGNVRPRVVLFGEQLPALEWFLATEEVKKADVLLVLGTSLQVFPFNELVSMAYNGGNGARIILVTQSETPYDGTASVRIHEPIGKVLTAIDTKITE